MKRLYYLERYSGKQVEELSPGAFLLALFYGWPLSSRLLMELFGWTLPLTSYAMGCFCRSRLSRPFIQRFIAKYQIDTREFAEPVEAYRDFDSFFTRRLKPEARPLAEGADRLVIPADGRYRFFQNIGAGGSFSVKGRDLSLSQLLGSEALASRYERGSLVLARLAPSDYHRFHFPCDCLPGKAQLLTGSYHSVHPLALLRRPSILIENRRWLTLLETSDWGTIAYVEVGALGVGRVVQTYQGGRCCQKGEEKGYFAFGGSTLLLLFEPGRLQLDEQLANLSAELEVRCLMGEPLNRLKSRVEL